MTYDALLTLQGWGVAEFREFSPELQQAARWALFARRLAPMLAGHRAVLNTSLAGLPRAQKTEAFKQKSQSAAVVPMLETVLLLGDTDG